MPPPPSLPGELIEEIFLRLPPNEPASLVRASLASKYWLSLLTGPPFHGLYRNFHGAAPMLGFLYTWPPDYVPEEKDSDPHFVLTTKFGVCIPDDEDWEDAVSEYSAWDCRHGRVLFSDMDMVPMLFTVWNPMTGCRTEMRAPVDYPSQRAAVVCAAGGCDHGACHEGPFRVVLIGLDNGDGGCVAYAHVSLPEVGDWSEPYSVLDLEGDRATIVNKPSVFIQDTLYFMLKYEDDDDEDDDDDDEDDIDGIAILKYDFGCDDLALIHAPPVEAGLADDDVLMAMEDGSLGFAHADGLTLNLWSRQMGLSGVVAWTQRWVINLKELLPIRNPKRKIRLIGSIECNDIIFVTTDVGIYEVNLKSLQRKKLWKRENYHALFPYMSFYNSQDTN